MDVMVFSESQSARSIFAKLENSKTHTVSFRPAADIKKLKTKNPVTCYIDASAVKENQLVSLLRSLSAQDCLACGIIDVKGLIRDPAMLFINGACDYLGPDQCKKAVSLDRLQSVWAFRQSVNMSEGKKTRLAAADTLMSAAKARNWESVQSGNEYLFYMMFVELDGYKDINQRIDEAAVGQMLASFQAAVASSVQAEQGRIWIWNNFGGIILFPFASKLEAIVAACLRLMLSRRLVSIEQCREKLLLSYRLVMCTGSTVYKERGKTGRIISDSVNSLSHIGIKFASPGNFYLSQGLFEQLIPEFKECFREAGCHDDMTLYRMRLPQKY